MLGLLNIKKIHCFTEARHWPISEFRGTKYTLFHPVSSKSTSLLSPPTANAYVFQAFSFLHPSCLSPQWVSYFCTPNLTTLITSGDKYTFWSPLLCLFLPPHVPSTVLRPNILHNTPFSSTHKKQAKSKLCIYNFYFLFNTSKRDSKYSESNGDKNSPNKIRFYPIRECNFFCLFSSYVFQICHSFKGLSLLVTSLMWFFILSVTETSTSPYFTSAMTLADCSTLNIFIGVDESS